MAKRIVIKYEKKNLDEEYEEYKIDFLQDIFQSHIQKNNLNIKRGDLVRIVPILTREFNQQDYQEYDEMDEDTKVEINFFRNEYMYIIDVKNNEFFIRNLDTDIDPYGALPNDFVLYEEPDYFTQNHWLRNNYPMFGHAQYLWLNPTIEMRKNLKINKQLNIYTYFFDCRNIFHKIIFKFSEKNNQTIQQKLKCVLNLFDEKMLVDLDNFNIKENLIRIYID
jgi:hypothetical protein